MVLSGVMANLQTNPHVQYMARLGWFPVVWFNGFNGFRTEDDDITIGGNGSGDTSIHIIALDGIVNVNSLFTLATIMGLVWWSSDGPRLAAGTDCLHSGVPFSSVGVGVVDQMSWITTLC